MNSPPDIETNSRPSRGAYRRNECRESEINRDVFGIYREGGLLHLIVLLIRKGRMVGLSLWVRRSRGHQPRGCEHLLQPILQWRQSHPGSSALTL